MDAIYNLCQNYKPIDNKISQLTVSKLSKKYKKVMVFNYSIYLIDNIYYLTNGLLFNVNQNHKPLKKSKNYEIIINTIKK